MISLETPIIAFGRLGARCAKSLKGIGLATAGDLLRHFPFRYEDYSRFASLTGPSAGPVTVRARIDLIKTRRSAKKRMLLTEATISDERGTANVVWFRQPFIAKLLKPGDRVLLSGRLERTPWGLSMTNPVYEKEAAGPSVHTARLVPVYPSTGGATVKQLRALLHAALPAVEEMEETLDAAMLEEHRLMGLKKAVRAIHFPETSTAAEAADRRFRFEELLRFQLKGAWARRSLRSRASYVIPFNEAATRAFVGSLPFALTGDQKKTAWRILQDMGSGRPMQRLVEGDVGSGKTAVAALAMHAVAEAGYASLLMAPTEILAEQHYATISKMLGGTCQPAGGRRHAVALRTRTRKEGSMDAAVIVGTHALLNGKQKFGTVALVVVDEQHRFGVSQRHLLLGRLAVSEQSPIPHFLSMTATPIPRSLALALYGDVEFSALREMPRGRKPVATRLVDERSRPRMMEEIRKEIAEGHKVFVVCPLIEASDLTGARSAEEEAERLRKEAFPDVEIGLLHGKIKAEQKRETMERFARGDLRLLVSTTVVEVGVDVPAATVMVVEDAERFGLAQLHQLRGRVGRSDLPSTCYLATSTDAPAARERLQAFMRAKDCFELAELDLRLRGPGDIFGTEQSGFDELKRFNPGDTALIAETKEAAARLLERDPELFGHPSLKEAVTAAGGKVHLE